LAVAEFGDLVIFSICGLGWFARCFDFVDVVLRFSLCWPKNLGICFFYFCGLSFGLISVLISDILLFVVQAILGRFFDLAKFGSSGKLVDHSAMLVRENGLQEDIHGVLWSELIVLARDFGQFILYDSPSLLLRTPSDKLGYFNSMH
jgi:hypothetical protein